jgi:hypothetical protein
MEPAKGHFTIVCIQSTSALNLFCIAIVLLISFFHGNILKFYFGTRVVSVIISSAFLLLNVKIENIYYVNLNPRIVVV